jgi:hypothetical protein
LSSGAAKAGAPVQLTLTGAGFSSHTPPRFKASTQKSTNALPPPKR